jgi:hypothetical protein
MAGNEINPTDITFKTLDLHLKHIRDLIIKDAVAAANADPPQEKDIWLAALKYAPGDPFPQAARRSWFGGWSNTAVLGVLTLVFGLLGLVGVGIIGSPTGAGAEGAKSLIPFLDIAKIFAGAIVGAAGATAAASRGIRAS